VCVDIKAFYGFLFSSGLSPGLYRLQSLFQEFSTSNTSITVEVIRHVSSAEEALDILLQIEVANRYNFLQITFCIYGIFVDLFI